MFVMRECKPIELERVYYERNVELGIDPYCHECISHVARADGYVVIRRDGFYKLHRWVWWKTTGERPEVVMHLCDNRICSNPAHLCAGTPLTNARDSCVKGRKGATPVVVQMIRSLYFEGASHSALQDFFKLSKATIYRVVKGIYYPDIAGASSRSGHARFRKLSAAQVRELRSLKKEGLTYRELGNLFGVSHTIIFHAVHENTYKDVL